MDEILERWNTISLKDRQEMLDKFNVDTLQGVMENKKLREYIKTNFIQTSTISAKWVSTQKNLDSIPKSKLIRRES